MNFDLWIPDACRMADVPYDDFIMTIAAGGYPRLPGLAPGSPRTFDETDMLALYVYGRLLAFGICGLRAGEYAGRAHDALRTHAEAKTLAIVLTCSGAKRVMVGSEPEAPARSEQIAFNVPEIRRLLTRRMVRLCKTNPPSERIS